MKRRTCPRLPVLAAVLVLILLAAPAIQAQIGGNVDLSWRVLSGGGASASSGGNVTLGGSLGQFGAGSSAGGRVALASGFWNPASTTPLAVTLASFTAEAQPGFVLVTWETVSEISTAGFNLYRSGSPDGPEAHLASTPSQAPGSTQGAAYQWLDHDVTAGQTYYYWLEDVDLAGAATFHGPVSATVPAPTAVTLDTLEASSGNSPATGWLFLAALAASAAYGLFKLKRHHRLPAIGPGSTPVLLCSAAIPSPWWCNCRTLLARPFCPTRCAMNRVG